MQVSYLKDVQDRLSAIDEKLTKLQDKVSSISDSMERLIGKPVSAIINDKVIEVLQKHEGFRQGVYIPVQGVREDDRLRFELDENSNPPFDLLRAVDFLLFDPFKQSKMEGLMQYVKDRWNRVDDHRSRAQLLVLAGPAGSGKSTFVDQLELHILDTYWKKRKEEQEANVRRKEKEKAEKAALEEEMAGRKKRKRDKSKAEAGKSTFDKHFDKKYNVGGINDLAKEKRDKRRKREQKERRDGLAGDDGDDGNKARGTGGRGGPKSGGKGKTSGKGGKGGAKEKNARPGKSARAKKILPAGAVLWGWDADPRSTTSRRARSGWCCCQASGTSRCSTPGATTHASWHRRAAPGRRRARREWTSAAMRTNIFKGSVFACSF